MNIDLRSDTVTKPSESMRKAMHNAELGDDVYGEDPRMNRFQAELAELFHKEAALFTPSGTMANAIAINIHGRSGDSILAEENSHCELYEGGGASALSGMQFQTFPFVESIDAEAAKNAVVSDHLQSSPTRLFVGENTHNFAGGLWRSAKEWSNVRESLPTHIPMHCDGARIWNAHIGSGDSLAALTESFQSVSVCFSKGLGAPIGSALLGPRDFIQRAQKIRKRLGGGMRQVGFLAAACEVAVVEQIQDLKTDHDRAKELQGRLSSLGEVEVRSSERATNMVFFRKNGLNPSQFVEQCASNGLLLHHIPGGWFRLVFHRDLKDNQIPEVYGILERTLAAEH